MKQKRIPAVFMRGGTSKGVFFRNDAIPEDTRLRNEMFLRAIGSPDPYLKQVDGMGGATSSTSKVVVISPSNREDCDVDYLFGAVSINESVVDYSGNCGNLSSAVGPFAIREGMVEAPENGMAPVRIWQVNTNKQIIAQVPMKDGEVQELGEFQLDGVTFPAAEIILDFLDPILGDGNMFPTGNQIDTLKFDGLGSIEVTMINAGNPHIFLNAESLGLQGAEMPSSFNTDRKMLELCEQIRARCTVLMGLSSTPEEATRLRPHTPKIAFVSPPQSYASSSGKRITPDDVDFTARILSMGSMHHAMTGTGGIAFAAAVAIEDTLIQQLIDPTKMVGDQVRIGHPSGVMAVAATTSMEEGRWVIEKVTMSRSARRLMEGWILVPYS